MKHNGKILLSLLLISIFGVSKAFDRIQLNEFEFVQNRKKLLDKQILEHGDRIRALNSSIIDLGLESEATNLISRVIEADRNLMDLVKAYVLLISSISSVCTYNKMAYKKVTSLIPNGLNATKVIINDEIRILEKVIKVTSQLADEAKKFVDKANEKVIGSFNDPTFIRDELKSLGKTKKTELEKNSASKEMLKKAEKLIEDPEAFVKGFRKIYSELSNSFSADKKLVNRLKETAEARVAVKDLVENDLSGDQPDQSEMTSLSDEIISAVREIFDVCVEPKSDKDF